MFFRCILLLFCLTAIAAQKGGGRRPAESSPVRKAVALARKTAESAPIEQVQEPDREPAEDSGVVSGLRPVRPIRPQTTQEDEGHAAPEPYSFSYAVQDPESGAATSREETQDINGEIVGYYHIMDKDGRMRRVDYTAGKDGFKATIKSNEEGLNNRSPADVKVELSASPSETVETYAPNNRPLASEVSLKAFGKTSQSRPIRFYQKPLPPPPPPPPEQPQDTQIYEAINEPEISQQQYLEEDIQPIAFESLKGNPPPTPPPARPLPPPPQPLPPPPQAHPTVQRYEPPVRPVARFTPVWNQVHREQGAVSLEPVRVQPQVQYQDVPQAQYQDIPQVQYQDVPQAQYQEDIPQVQYQEDIPQDSIQEIQQTVEVAPPPPPAATKTIPSAPLPAPKQVVAAPVPQPQTPVLIIPPRQVYSVPAPPPQLEQPISFPQPDQPISAPAPPPPPPTEAPQTVQKVVPTGNLVFGQHIEPLSQEQLSQIFKPFNLQPLTSSRQKPIVFDAAPPQAINLFAAVDNDGKSIMSYIPPPQSSQSGDNQGFRIVVHREQKTYSLPPLRVPQGIRSIIEQQQPRQEFVAQVKDELPEQAQITQRLPLSPPPLRHQPPPPPPPPPVPLSPPPVLVRPTYRPIPKQVFEEQVYEPHSQQTYEPLQQTFEAPQVIQEDVVVPQKCDCNQPIAAQTQASYGIKGAQSVVAPVKGRLSPYRNLHSFIPKAYRVRRDSAPAQSESAEPSGVGSA